MKTILALALSTGFAWAGNAGFVTGLGIIDGQNGKRYLKVNHSVTNVDFGSGSNRLWGTFYVPFDEYEPTSLVRYADLQKSLTTRSITVDAVDGYASDKVLVNSTDWVPVVTNWMLRAP